MTLKSTETSCMLPGVCFYYDGTYGAQINKSIRILHVKRWNAVTTDCSLQRILRPCKLSLVFMKMQYQQQFEHDMKSKSSIHTLRYITYSISFNGNF